MEKYSHWRDSGTGIQPFLPLKPAKTSSTLDLISEILNKYIVGPPVAIIRLSLISIYYFCFTIFSSILNIIPSGSIKYLIGRIYYICVARLALFVMGFYWINSEKVTLMRGRKHEKKEKSHNVNHGDVIICNSLSYIDILYFLFRFNPTFVKVYENGKVKPISVKEALADTGSYPTLKEEEGAVTIKELSKSCQEKKNGPIVVFPEGTTTNGKGILKFVPVFSDITTDDNLPIHIYSIKYAFSGHNLSFTVGSKIPHLFRTCCQLYNTMTIKYLDSQESKFTEIAAQADLPNADTEGQLGAHASKLIGQILRVRKTGLNVRDKCEFLDYYNEINNKGYKTEKKSK